MSDAPAPHFRPSRPTGPMLRLLRRLAAGHPIDWPTAPGPSSRGTAGIVFGLLHRGLIAPAVAPAAGYELTEAGRNALAEARTAGG